MRPHERLEAAMYARRRELGYKTWRELALAADISYETLRSVRRGESAPAEATMDGLEHALHWQAGSVQALLDGGEPTELPLRAEANLARFAKLNPRPKRSEELLAQRTAREAERAEDQAQIDRLAELADLLEDAQEDPVQIEAVLGVLRAFKNKSA